MAFLEHSEQMSLGNVGSGACCVYLKALSHSFAIHYLSTVYSGWWNRSWQLKWNKCLLTLAPAMGSYLARAGESQVPGCHESQAHPCCVPLPWTKTKVIMSSITAADSSRSRGNMNYKNISPLPSREKRPKQRCSLPQSRGWLISAGTDTCNDAM